MSARAKSSQSAAAFVVRQTTTHSIITAFLRPPSPPHEFKMRTATWREHDLKILAPRPQRAPTCHGNPNATALKARVNATFRREHAGAWFPTQTDQNIPGFHGTFAGARVKFARAPRYIRFHSAFCVPSPSDAESPQLAILVENAHHATAGVAAPSCGLRGTR